MHRLSRFRSIILAMIVCATPRPAVGGEEVGGLVTEWRVREIRFEGNSWFTDGELRERMKLEAGDPFRQWQLDEDVGVIRNFYRKNGFVGFDIEDVEKDADVRTGEITVVISIKEGRRVLFRDAIYEGNHAIGDEELDRRLDLKRGEPYRRDRVDAFLRDITEYYSERGHLRLKVASRPVFTASGDSVDVVITFDEGYRTFVGDVIVGGNERVDPRVVRRASLLRRGDLIRPRLLLESQQSLYQIDLFKSAAFAFEDTDSPDTVDVRINVRERKFKTFDVGGGYASVDGVKASFEWNQRNIFSSAEGIRTRSEVTYQPFELSRIRFSNAYASAFTQPFFFDTLVRAQWSLSYKVSDYQTYDQEVASFKALFTRTFGIPKRLSLLVDLNSTRIFKVDPEGASADVKANEGRQTANSLTLAYVLDLRKDLFYPEEKSLLTVETTLSGGPLIGEVDFYRVFADFARYELLSHHPLRPILAARIRAGIVTGLQTSDTVLPGEQFSIGGANTLRGYKEESIGPLGDEGDPNTHSGNYVLLLNLETRFTIRKALGGVFFFDAGNVYNDDLFPRSPFLLTSFGAGIRYRSPIGPVRVEGALRVDGLSSGVGRIHFSVGQAF